MGVISSCAGTGVLFSRIKRIRSTVSTERLVRGGVLGLQMIPLESDLHVDTPLFTWFKRVDHVICEA